MISKILALEALIGTIRAHLPVPVRNVSDITPEQHSHEIINAIGLLSDKGKQLAEARAEIERLKNEHENSLDKAKNYTLELSGATTKQAGELADKDRQLTEARAEIERKGLKIRQLDIECDVLIKQQRKDKTSFANALQRLSQEIERKDALIEQMREALNVLVASATPSGPLWHGSAEMQIARAALSAAERSK